MVVLARSKKKDHVLPSINGMISVDPFDMDCFIWRINSDRSTVDFDIFHVVQTFPDGHHTVLADLDHDAIVDNAGFGGQSRWGFQGSAQNYETGPSDFSLYEK